MHNVVRRATRLPNNINGTFQIIQFRPESENIDDVDRMTEPAQLLRLLPDECAIMWHLRSGVHIRDKQYLHSITLRLVARLHTSTSLRTCHRQPVKLYSLFNHPRARKLPSQPCFARLTHAYCDVPAIEQIFNLSSQRVRISRWDEKAGRSEEHTSD